jgi:nucleoside-diphosphate-sugar epimerase
VRVLITGSSGRIGSSVAGLIAQHATCVGLDLVPGKFTSRIGSITDRGAVTEVMEGVAAIVHCAAYLTPHVGVVGEDEFRRVNVHGTEVLLDAALQHHIKRFVFTSTTSIYGCSTRPKTEAVWVTEDLAPNPEDIYDVTKLEAEGLCRQASLAGVTTIILRMSRCFPEPDHLQVFYRLYRGVSRGDVAQAHWLAASGAGLLPGVFNVSAHSPFQRSDAPVLLADPWAVIDRLYPQASALFERLQWPKPSSIDRVYVVDKAKLLLNYQPRDDFWTFLNAKAQQLL